MAFSHQIRCDCPYVIGQIDIFREALDHPIGFGKGCSALENEVLTELGTEEGLKGPDNPDVLFEQPDHRYGRLSSCRLVKAEGEGEWNARKHGGSKKRLWRKLHLGLDEETLEVRAVGFTTSNVGEPQMGWSKIMPGGPTGEVVAEFRVRPLAKGQWHMDDRSPPRLRVVDDESR